MERSLPAEPFTHEVFLLLAQGDVDLPSFADSIGVHPRWLQRVLAGEITELPLLTVVGLCKALRDARRRLAPRRGGPGLCRVAAHHLRRRRAVRRLRPAQASAAKSSPRTAR